MISLTWRPITPPKCLGEHARLALLRLNNATQIWERSKLEFSEDYRREFFQKLNRSIAVETGIIEGLYEIDRGLTQTLVSYGFSRDAVERTGESVPNATLNMLRDQLQSLDLIMDFVEGSRDFSSGYIRELHALIARSQDVSMAVDPSGRSVPIPLLSGQYKSQPNNPTLHDGSVHEYAPVEQVASEVDRLAALFENATETEHPVVVASWLHHRFTQIHPFQDGNGRVARVLASMVLLKAELFPLHIRREDRAEYIDALERADDGTLDSLVQLVVRRARDDMLWAVSELARIAAAPLLGGRTADVAAAVAGQFARKRLEVLSQRRRVNVVAEDLVNCGAEALASNLEKAGTEFSAQRIPFSFDVDYGGSTDQRGHRWRYQIVEAAKRLNHWANVSENNYWLRSRITLAGLRMRFVMSVHHVGSPVSGFMAAVAFAEIQYPETEPDDRHEQELVHCSERAFTFTELDVGEELNRSFEAWLDEAQAVALRILGTAAI